MGREIHVFWIALVLLFPTFEQIFVTNDVRIKVLENDAARECVSPGDYGRGAALRRVAREAMGQSDGYRTGATNKTYGYCGAIKTDLGWLDLPDEKYAWLRPFYPPRAEVHDALQNGCTYIVQIVGYRQTHKRQWQEQLLSAIFQPHIASVRKKLGCAHF